MNERRPKTPWHLLLGRLLSLTLEPVRIQVLVELPLLSDAPRADIVLLCREGEGWSPEQRRWLADGLRHAEQAHLLIEFKRSEPLDLKAVQQLNAYDYFYREGRALEAGEVACFLVVSSTPPGDWQGRLGFSPTEWPGVYRGNGAVLERVRVLLLNELAPTAHNAPLKCFASHQAEQRKAFTVLRDSGFMRLSRIIERFITGLWRMMLMSHAPQAEELTPDDVIAMGKEWIDALLDATPVDEVLSHYGRDEVLSHYQPDEVLSHYQPDEVLSHYRPDEVLSHYRPDEVMSHFEPEQRLGGLTEQQILAYLERLRRSKN